jgi:hypothetical protein
LCITAVKSFITSGPDLNALLETNTLAYLAYNYANIDTKALNDGSVNTTIGIKSAK